MLSASCSCDLWKRQRASSHSNIKKASAVPVIQHTRVVFPRRPNIWKPEDPPTVHRVTPISSLCSALTVAERLNGKGVSAPADWRTARECGSGLFGQASQQPEGCSEWGRGGHEGRVGGDQAAVGLASSKGGPEVRAKRSIFHLFLPPDRGGPSSGLRVFS